MKQYLIDNTWVWAGTALVLITLSGQTRTYGIWIAVLSIVGQIVTMILSANDGDD